MDAVQQMQHKVALRLGGSEAVAEVTKLGVERPSARTVVRYSFNVQGETFTGNAIVPSQLYPSVAQSDTIPIRYLPTQPMVNHPSAWAWTALLDLESFYSVLLLVAAGMLFQLPGRILLMRVERRVVAEGTPVVASITECVPLYRAGGFIVKYEFRTDSGTEMQGNGWYDSSQESGANICVLYLPQNPKQNQPYPSRNYCVAH
jgi:hypothetical protein